MSSFSDPAAVARYGEGPPRMVPGFHDLQRMAALLLAERCGDTAHVLVLGAGGGLELNAFAGWQPGWAFTGVDPSAEMLALAAQTTAPHAARITLQQGLIDSAPEGPFDGATCLLTLHFVPVADRLPTLTALRRRLKPGAPLVAAHFSLPQDAAERALWMNRYVAFAISSGLPEEKLRTAATAIGAQLPIVSPEQDEALLRQAGFTGVSLFYAAFTFRGWVGYAG